MARSFAFNPLQANFSFQRPQALLAGDNMPIPDPYGLGAGWGHTVDDGPQGYGAPADPTPPPMAPQTVNPAILALVRSIANARSPFSGMKPPARPPVLSPHPGFSRGGGDTFIPRGGPYRPQPLPPHIIDRVLGGMQRGKSLPNFAPHNVDRIPFHSAGPRFFM